MRMSLGNLTIQHCHMCSHTSFERARKDLQKHSSVSNLGWWFVMMETLSESFESLSCPARHERGSKRLRAVPSLDQFPRNNTFDSGVDGRWRTFSSVAKVVLLESHTVMFFAEFLDYNTDTRTEGSTTYSELPSHDGFALRCVSRGCLTLCVWFVVTASWFSVFFVFVVWMVLFQLGSCGQQLRLGSFYSDASMI